jgi:GNAT superfamily N-acetyltransferase
MAAPQAPAAGDVVVRPLLPRDVEAADRVMRIAFGTFLGAPDPERAFGDAEYVRPRFAAAPDWAFAAELDDELVGSNLATVWGSYAFFGPLTVRPDLWDRGIASRLMEPVVELFEREQVRQAGLFTFAASPRHVGLYEKFGFWAQHLTPVMRKPVAAGAEGAAMATYSRAPEGERAGLLAACGEVTDAIFPGLDVAHEIRSADEQGLGDTALLQEGSGLGGLAVCHCGAGEAGGGACYVKFGAVTPGPQAGERFERLLDACEALAAERGLQTIIAGVNMARHDAYRRMLARGYRTFLQGVVMQRPNQPGYCRPDVHAIDDLR